MPTPATIKTRILIISDTHSAPLTTHTPHPFRAPLPSADVLLHCGDLTNGGSHAEFERALAMLAQIDAPLKLVIAGNHDIGLDAAYRGTHGVRWDVVRGRKGDEAAEGEWRKYVRAARELWTGERARRAGVVYCEEGVGRWELGNGAVLTIYTSPYQPAFCHWAFDYTRSQDRWNPPALVHPSHTSIATTPIPDFPALDIVMTHGPPASRLDLTASRINAGCTSLLKALARSRPRLFCCGHIHEAWGAETVSWDAEKVGAMDAERDVKEYVRGAKVVAGGPGMDRDAIKYLDISATGEELKRGEETLVVNACVMNLMGRPVQAPFVVDLDLPSVERAEKAEGK